MIKVFTTCELLLLLSVQVLLFFLLLYQTATFLKNLMVYDSLSCQLLPKNRLLLIKIAPPNRVLLGLLSKDIFMCSPKREFHKCWNIVVSMHGSGSWQLQFFVICSNYLEERSQIAMLQGYLLWVKPNEDTHCFTGLHTNLKTKTYFWNKFISFLLR